LDAEARFRQQAPVIKVKKRFKLPLLLRGAYLLPTAVRDSGAAKQAGSEMWKTWRISSFNGTLLATYFVPSWAMVAFSIITSPVHGLYERPNISVALFISDHLHLAGLSTVRVAWLLALGRLTVVAFFVLFVLSLTVPGVRKSGGHREALGISVGMASLISFVCMMMAAQVGETAALRLHATELLMLLGGGIVLLLEGPATAQAQLHPAPAKLDLQHPELLSHR
jgi:hypothetical protein